MGRKGGKKAKGGTARRHQNRPGKARKGKIDTYGQYLKKKPA